MATPTIDNLLLPINVILVLPDEGDKPTTGVIFRRSLRGGGRFQGENGTYPNPIIESDHILFVREITTEVIVDEVEYLAMHENAVVGIIP